jgi:hypothetical protein
MDASMTPASEATTSQASTPVASNHNSNTINNTASNAGGPNHGKPPRRILACELCQHRKIKCDRHFPCANCTKVRMECAKRIVARPKEWWYIGGKAFIILVSR